MFLDFFNLQYSFYDNLFFVKALKESKTTQDDVQHNYKLEPISTQLERVSENSVGRIGYNIQHNTTQRKRKRNIQNQRAGVELVHLDRQESYSVTLILITFFNLFF